MTNGELRPGRDDTHLWDRLPSPLKGAWALMAGVAATGLATLICMAAHRALPVHGVAMVYILTVVTSAVAFGMQGGISTAISAFLAYNYFFLEPTYTFSINDPRDLLALSVFFAVAVGAGSLAGRLREVAEQARLRSRSLEILNAFALDLSAASTAAAVAEALATTASAVAASPAVIFSSTPDGLTRIMETPEAPPFETADWQAAERCVTSRSMSYPSAPGWPGQHYEFRPLIVQDRCAAVLGLHRKSHDEATAVTLDAMVHQAGIAFERLSLAEEKVMAEKAADAERLRSALLSAISHDIKTPLASIQGSVTSLREFGAKLPDGTKADLLVAIEEETTKLSRFVTNMLDMMRIQASPTLAREWVDLADMIALTAARIRKLLPHAKIQLDVPMASALVRGDETLIEHVLLNILENAVYFSPDGADIRAAVSAWEWGYRVTIEDEGAGIEAADLPKIFEKFFRGKGARSHGSGLGLAICKEVMTALGGHIEATSPLHDGRGTRMTLDFPATTDAKDGAPS